ncbi:MAG: hypothetical protein LBM93_04425, partial [Oscillospiraceae bacterium]|nr:hypothetical protein [Oscillospiraceae bacterium]
SNTEYATGEKVVIITDDTTNTDGVRFGELFVKDEKITIQGEEYKVLGYAPMNNSIPFLSVHPETEISGQIEISPSDGYDTLFTHEQYKRIRELFQSKLGDLVNMPALNFPDTDAYYLYNTIIIISILISVVSALIIALLYNYILIKRHRTLTIFRICGCTRGKLVVMYLAECLLISVPLFILTSLGYYKLLLPILAKQYPNMVGAYSLNLYVLIFGIYFASSIFVMLVMIFKTIPKKAVSIKGVGV